VKNPSAWGAQGDKNLDVKRGFKSMAKSNLKVWLVVTVLLAAEAKSSMILHPA
jgi:hypothetical protein